MPHPESRAHLQGEHIAVEGYEANGELSGYNVAIDSLLLEDALTGNGPPWQEIDCILDPCSCLLPEQWTEVRERQ